MKSQIELQTNEIRVYLLLYRGGRGDFRFVADEEIRKHGGVEAFEAQLSEIAIWFYPIGTIVGRLGRDGWPRRATKRVNELLKEWEEHGCPKVMGRIGKVTYTGDSD